MIKMATHGLHTEPHNAGTVRATREHGGEEIPVIDNRFHTDRNERVVLEAKAHDGFIFRGYQIGNLGFCTDNPATVSSEHGYSITALFEKSPEQKELEAYIEERRIEELGKKIEQWTEDFHNLKKPQAGGV